MNLINQLKEDIRKLVRELKPEDELLDIMKKRLTKKEFKYYILKASQATKSDILKELKCDEQRLDEIIKNTILKLNQEKIKHELMV